MICIVGVEDGVDLAVVGVGVANGVSNGVAEEMEMVLSILKNHN